MIDRLLDFLTGREAPTLDAPTDELQLSVAAFLIQAARLDSNFDAAERPRSGACFEKIGSWKRWDSKEEGGDNWNTLHNVLLQSWSTSEPDVLDPSDFH